MNRFAVLLVCMVALFAAAEAADCPQFNNDTIRGTWYHFSTALSTEGSQSSTSQAVIKTDSYKSTVTFDEEDCHCSLQISNLAWTLSNTTLGQSISLTAGDGLKCSDSASSCTEAKCNQTTAKTFYKYLLCSEWANNSIVPNQIPILSSKRRHSDNDDDDCLYHLPVGYIIGGKLTFTPLQGMAKQEWYLSLWFLITAGVVGCLIVLLILCCCCACGVKLLTSRKRSAYDEM